MKSNKRFILFSLCLVYLVFYSGRDIERSGFFKPATNDHYNFIAINEILMWVSNNGDGSHDPATDGNGFYWPGGKLARKAAIFEDGLVWGGIINGDTVVNGNTHRQGLQAGKILSLGVADDPNNPRYRVYKIRKNWEYFPVGEERNAYERDYQEWPVEDGAPWVDVDGDGIFSRGIDQPEFVGDEVLWYVSNDMDTSRSTRTYGSNPIGLEFQTTVWGYDKKNFLGDVVFKKYQIINKGHWTIDSMHLAYWTDDDLGDASDDYVGCDTVLNLGYSYNGDNNDGDGSGIQYGPNPPAVGHLFVQGPVVPATPTDSAKYKGKWLKGYKNLPLTSFMLYIGPHWEFRDPQMNVKQGSIELYNNMRSLFWNGNPIIDPHTGLQVKFAIPGDPVNNVGWYEGPGWPGGEDPSDRRFLISSGPFTMIPGDTQEVVIAILMARGEDHIDSIKELRKACRSVQLTYDLDFDITPKMTQPIRHVVQKDQQVTLYWDPNTEAFEVTDPLLTIKGLQGVNDTTYSFEGYRVWQFRDLQGTDPRILATYDLQNNVDVIYAWQTIDGFPAYVAAISGANEGIRRSHVVTSSIYDEQLLNNANPYYFAVTAYAYSKHSDPAYIESEPVIIEVIPGVKKIDDKIIYDSGEKIIADHIAGDGAGYVEVSVVDPYALTGDEYRVVFEGESRDVSYSFINYTSNDTIFSDCTSFYIDTLGSVIFDGFAMNVYNTGLENTRYGENYAINQLLEIKGPAGKIPEVPTPVFNQYNSTGSWQIRSYGFHPDSIQNLNVNDQIGYKEYEIRFTETGSEYYTSGGYFGYQPWRSNDPKAADTLVRVPFEIWELGSTDSEDDDIRLAIKILDDYRSLLEDSARVDQNGYWSQLENGNWEPIFAFLQDSVYEEPLPETSGRVTDVSDSRFGRFVISGQLPAEGTVIRITTWKPLSEEDVFSFVVTAPETKNYNEAKANLDDISVFPNPFFATAVYSGYVEQNFVRFTNLPTEVTLRIFTLGGTYVKSIDKNDDNPWLDWDLRNNSGEKVASGVYIAHLEMPNIGEKVMKLAVILENVR